MIISAMRREQDTGLTGGSRRPAIAAAAAGVVSALSAWRKSAYYAKKISNIVPACRFVRPSSAGAKPASCAELVSVPGFAAE
jgi:hypothetical protein